jgi:16S rRNA (cytosine1402-N4)-methyltransferase
MYYHVPALLDESIKGLNIKSGGTYVDVTFGGGGHSSEILKHLKKGRVIAFDQDEDAAQNIPDDPRFTFLHQNFRFLKNNLRFLGIEAVDGLIADLGVSFHQFDTPERGFTFRSDVRLDMRMNRRSRVTAANLLKNLDENSIAKILFNYGELINSRRIARELVAARSEKPISTVNDIISVIGKLAPPHQENKFYARVFQALRIAVNHEIENLKEMLEQALEMLKKDGRLVVITYHSLEDRVVKNFMRTGNFDGEEKKDFYGNIIAPFRVLTKKSIVPDNFEVEENKRSRSARLRIAEKI